MKKIIIILAFLVFAVSAWAGSGTTQKIGNTYFHDFGNGVRGTSQQIGNTTFHDFNDGTRGTSQQIGNTTFHDYNKPAQQDTGRSNNKMMDYIGDDHPLHPNYKNPWD